MHIFTQENQNQDGHHQENDEQDRRSEEKILFEAIDSKNYEKIKKKVTPRALQKCESNTLLISMKVR